VVSAFIVQSPRETGEYHARITCGLLALDGVTVTILNADKRIGPHVFVTVARNDAGQGSNLGPVD
jgi:hypothetical protein